MMVKSPPIKNGWGLFVSGGVSIVIKAIIKSFSYPTGKVVLRDMDIHIPAGEFVVVTGTSGSGKSTLVQYLTGVIPHFIRGDLDGKVEIKGKDLSSLSLPAGERRHRGSSGLLSLRI